MKLCTQANRLLADLKRGDKITPLVALKRYGCLRLSGRVYDLKQRGHKIRSKLVTRSGARVAEYSLA